MTTFLETVARMAERDAEIRRLLEAGWSHQDVADRYKVERQRIQQIAQRLGLGPPPVNLTEIPGGYSVVGGEGTDEEAIRARVERALRIARLDVRRDDSIEPVAEADVRDPERVPLEDAP